jgi:hypothetical protein
VAGCEADRGGTFGVAGFEERRRLAGATSRSPSTTYVPSPTVGRNPASLELQYLPVVHLSHTNAAHGIQQCLVYARV